MTTALARPDNMRLWETLGKTDPSATKKFKRAGGFSGTAVRPMWSNKRMTEEFGSCGIGWGQTEPQFQTVEAGGEILVYCTVGLWYNEKLEGSSLSKSQTVYGVGGDKVLTQIFEKDGQGNKIKDADGRFKTYPQTDDEAFKKAYTDALSNAMKFIGVAADVHMGLFDDSKYVQSMVEEFKEQVADEIAVQKAGGEPAPIEFLYSNKILICRPIAADVRKKGDKEFCAVKLNGNLGKTQMIFCWQKRMYPALTGSVGKLVKLAIDGAGDFFNIEDILEIDGEKWEAAPGTDPVETQARLLASTMDFKEDELMLTHKTLCKGSWAATLTGLQNEKKRREAAEVQPA
jgi:hypothetical protein